MSNAAASQLSDMNPSIDMPLRIKAFGNVPERTKKMGKDEQTRTNMFSPYAISKMKASIKCALDTEAPEETLLTILNSTKTQPPAMSADADATANTQLKDFGLLALSSKRAGKSEVEAISYLSMALIYDNQHKLKLAIENYKLYLALCEQLGDLVGQALAANCIGANYMYLSSSSGEGMLNAANADDLAVATNIQKAMFYHEKHMRIADNGGQFVALTNIGLCYGMQKNIIQSAKFHQDALRSAIKMQSVYGQAIAVGNLGMLAMYKSDYTTARTCFEQHLNLVQALQDKESEVNAWKMLAELSALEGNADVLDSLQEARRVAAKEGYTSELRKVHCLLGRAHGLLHFGDFAQGISETIITAVEP